MRQNLPITQREILIPDGEEIVSRTDLKGKILDVTPTVIRVSGFTEAELLGQPHNIIRHPDMPSAAFADLWATLRAGRSFCATVPVITPSILRSAKFIWQMDLVYGSYPMNLFHL